uniref:Uncharacterized protein n=1 Tax=Trichuris muris TaxID=70415 RepID=A0A5S6QE71_TRIMR
MRLTSTALLRFAVCSMIILSVHGTIYFLPTHSYPEQSQQTNTPDKKQQLEQLEMVAKHEGRELELQKLRSSPRSWQKAAKTAGKLGKNSLRIIYITISKT